MDCRAEIGLPAEPASPASPAFWSLGAQERDPQCRARGRLFRREPAFDQVYNYFRLRRVGAVRSKRRCSYRRYYLQVPTSCICMYAFLCLQLHARIRAGSVLQSDLALTLNSLTRRPLFAQAPAAIKVKYHYTRCRIPCWTSTLPARTLSDTCTACATLQTGPPMVSQTYLAH